MRRHKTWLPFLWAETLWEVLKDGFGMCDHCITEAKGLYAAARKVCWDELPEMFGLPKWEKLEGMRQASLSA